MLLSLRLGKDMELAHLTVEIVARRRQIDRQRKEIRDLQRAGVSTEAAQELLARMQAKVRELSAERTREVKEQRRKYQGTDKAIIGPLERRFR